MCWVLSADSILSVRVSNRSRFLSTLCRWLVSFTSRKWLLLKTSAELIDYVDSGSTPDIRRVHCSFRIRRYFWNGECSVSLNGLEFENKFWKKISFIFRFSLLVFWESKVNLCRLVLLDAEQFFRVRPKCQQSGIKLALVLPAIAICLPFHYYKAPDQGYLSARSSIALSPDTK